MFPLLKDLKDLHDLDQVILGLRAEVAEARRELEAREAALASGEAALEAHRAEVKEARAQERLKEVELKGLEEQVASWTVKLNTTRDNKEYQAILHQLGTLRERKGGLEEEILGLMDVDAGAESSVKEEERRLAEEKRVFEARRREQEGAVAAKEREAGEVALRREARSAGLPPEVLARYDRIRTHRQGAGMAAVEAEVCQGCSMGLTPNQVNLLLRDSELVACQSCGRILYLA